MGFKRNLDYEILKAMSERKTELMNNGFGALDVMQLLKQLFPKIGTEAQVNANEYEKLRRRVDMLVDDGLLKRATLAHGVETSQYIRSITPEGRLFLDRLENNRFSRRIADWLMGIIAGLVLATLVKYLGLEN